VLKPWCRLGDFAYTFSPAARERFMTVDGLSVVPSKFDPKTTMDRLVSAVTSRGITIIARIDHAAAAEKAGLALRPTELVIFGNPKVGTALMQAVQTAGIDLPLKALVWQDASGKTWLTYNDPHWIASRHGIGGDAGRTVQSMAAALATLAEEAAG
jgi:uncharacterized protein (DUF302 family)